MSAGPTEREMIQRLVDAARTSGDILAAMCGRVMNGAPVRPETMVDLLRWLRQASGCAQQLAHTQQNPQFFELRDELENLSRMLAGVSLRPTPKLGLLLSRVGQSLDMLWRYATKMATGRPVSRHDVLAMLNDRAVLH